MSFTRPCCRHSTLTFPLYDYDLSTPSSLFSSWFIPDTLPFQRSSVIFPSTLSFSLSLSLFSIIFRASTIHRFNARGCVNKRFSNETKYSKSNRSTLLFRDSLDFERFSIIFLSTLFFLSFLSRSYFELGWFIVLTQGDAYIHDFYKIKYSKSKRFNSFERFSGLWFAFQRSSVFSLLFIPFPYIPSFDDSSF